MGRRRSWGGRWRRLGVELILANSPQAKGRVERMGGTLQDRLVREMGLRGVAGVGVANGMLGAFLADLNGRFAVEPARPRPDLHRPVVRGVAVVETADGAGRLTVQLRREGQALLWRYDRFCGRGVGFCPRQP